jgi:hypothetical protein
MSDDLHPYFKEPTCRLRDGIAAQLPTGEWIGCTLPLNHPGERHECLWGKRWEWTDDDRTPREVTR